MNDLEFMSYVSGLVDICFSDQTEPKTYTLRYGTSTGPKTWIIDQVDNFFEEQTIVDPQQILPAGDNSED